MSYIFIDVDEARRCSALINAQAEQLGELTDGEPNELSRTLEAFRLKLSTLSADLLEETETYASADEKMKRLHLTANDGRND
jgi:hypothetical protein